jgi:hypothetical protein
MLCWSTVTTRGKLVLRCFIERDWKQSSRMQPRRNYNLKICILQESRPTCTNHWAMNTEAMCHQHKGIGTNHLPFVVPVVWSTDGPVPYEDVLPFRRVQSNWSPFMLLKWHQSSPKSQNRAGGHFPSPSVMSSKAISPWYDRPRTPSKTSVNSWVLERVIRPRRHWLPWVPVRLQIL